MNGSLSQCAVCGQVFACDGYSITMTDLTRILSELHYSPVCPACYSSVLRAIVIREEEGKTHEQSISHYCTVCGEVQDTEAHRERLGSEGKVGGA